MHILARRECNILRREKGMIQMINVAVMGYGTVGSGVVELIHTNKDRIARSAGDSVNVKYILDVRDFENSPYAELFIKDFAVIENDPEVTIVVETIGAVGVAQEFTRRALAAGKSVVTSNKEVVANFGTELLALAEKNGVSYLFEASVGGGIPVLRSIYVDLASNRISEVNGILNGTTNYILTRMANEGCTYEEVLKDAQKLGYAEANPAADVEGHDACRKICILAALGFGKHVYPEQVKTEGITHISLDDVEYADGFGAVIKLIGHAKRETSGKITASVRPTLVSRDHILSSVIPVTLSRHI